MHSLLITVLQALYLFAPLLVGSAIAGIVLRFQLFPGLSEPIDARKTFRGRRLFGESKTWRGVVVAIASCVATLAAQKYIVGTSARSLWVVDYSTLNVLLFGTAMGGGAMLGELPNSFVKRQLGIVPGKTTRGPLAILFYLWDQVDLLTTAWPFVACWTLPTVRLVVTSFAVALVLHPAVSSIGYILGARNTAR